MTTSLTLPALSLGGDEDRAERAERLTQAYEAMCRVADVLWPDRTDARDPDAVRWPGSIVSLHEVEDHLYVAWKDEDHWDKYAKVAELAWAAVGHESGLVVHENADIDGLPLPAARSLF
jgi:hypothetical protein